MIMSLFKKPNFLNNAPASKAILENSMTTRSNAKFDYSATNFLKLTYPRGDSHETLELIGKDIAGTLHDQFLYNRVIDNNMLTINIGVRDHMHEDLTRKGLFNNEIKPEIEQSLKQKFDGEEFDINAININLSIDNSLSSDDAFTIKIGESYKSSMSVKTHHLFLLNGDIKTKIATLYDDQPYFIVDAISLVEAEEFIAANIIGEHCLQIEPNCLSAKFTNTIVHTQQWQGDQLTFTLSDQQNKDSAELIFKVEPTENSKLAGPRIAEELIKQTKKDSSSEKVPDGFAPLPESEVITDANGVNDVEVDVELESMTLSKVDTHTNDEEVFEEFTILDNIAQPLFHLTLNGIVATGKKYLNTIGINEVLVDDNDSLITANQALQSLGVQQMLKPEEECSFNIFDSTTNFGRSSIPFPTKMSALKGLDSEHKPQSLSRFAFSRNQLALSEISSEQLEITNINDKHVMLLDANANMFKPMTTGKVHIKEGSQLLIGAFLFELVNVTE
jgi:copper chaperone CopZ